MRTTFHYRWCHHLSNIKKRSLSSMLSSPLSNTESNAKNRSNNVCLLNCARNHLAKLLQQCVNRFWPRPRRQHCKVHHHSAGQWGSAHCARVLQCHFHFLLYGPTLHRTMDGITENWPTPIDYYMVSFSRFNHSKNCLLVQ